MEKKHTDMKITFKVIFDKPMSDSDITQFMKEVNLDIDHSTVSDIELVKLSK